MPRVFSPEQLAKGIKGFGDKALEDLAGREQDIQRGKTVELLRRAGKEMYENPIVNTAVGLSPVLGDIQAGVEAYRSAQEGDWGNAGLNAMGMLPFIPMLGKTVLRDMPTQQLESLNPTGTIMTEYNPASRATLPLGKNLTTLDVTMGANPDEMITIYRGVPYDVSEISPGDFITTNEKLAKDYAGTGKVISQKVPARTVLDDLTEPLGEEYIYRP